MEHLSGVRRRVRPFTCVSQHAEQGNDTLTNCSFEDVAPPPLHTIYTWDPVLLRVKVSYALIWWKSTWFHLGRKRAWGRIVNSCKEGL